MQGINIVYGFQCAGRWFDGKLPDYFLTILSLWTVDSIVKSLASFKQLNWQRAKARFVRRDEAGFEPRTSGTEAGALTTALLAQVDSIVSILALYFDFEHRPSRLNLIVLWCFFFRWNYSTAHPCSCAATRVTSWTSHCRPTVPRHSDFSA